MCSLIAAFKSSGNRGAKSHDGCSRGWEHRLEIKSHLLYLLREVLVGSCQLAANGPAGTGCSGHGTEQLRAPRAARRSLLGSAAEPNIPLILCLPDWSGHCNSHRSIPTPVWCSLLSSMEHVSPWGRHYSFQAMSDAPTFRAALHTAWACWGCTGLCQV